MQNSFVPRVAARGAGLRRGGGRVLLDLATAELGAGPARNADAINADLRGPRSQPLFLLRR